MHTFSVLVPVTWLPCLALPFPFHALDFEISLNFPSRNLEGGTALPRPDQEVLHKPHFLHTTQTQTMATPPNSNMSPAEKAKAFDMAQLEMEYRVDLYNA